MSVEPRDHCSPYISSVCDSVASVQPFRTASRNDFADLAYVCAIAFADGGTGAFSTGPSTLRPVRSIISLMVPVTCHAIRPRVR